MMKSILTVAFLGTLAVVTPASALAPTSDGLTELVALTKEVQAQQNQLLDNQGKIEAKLTEITETILYGPNLRRPQQVMKACAQHLVSLLAGLSLIAQTCKADPQQLLAAVKDLQVQQKHIAENQTAIDSKIAAVAEDVRVARIYSSRLGGAHKPPPPSK